MSELTVQHYREANNWLASGDTGISSKALLFTALDTRERHWEFGNYPSDPSDLGRCLRMLKLLPWVRERAFAAIAQRCRQWERLIRHWDELAALMEAEVGSDWSKGDSAPRTYQRMKDIIAGEVQA